MTRNIFGERFLESGFILGQDDLILSLIEFVRSDERFHFLGGGQLLRSINKKFKLILKSFSRHFKDLRIHLNSDEVSIHLFTSDARAP